MKKFTQVMLLVLFAVSVAFAQQSKDFSAEKSTKKVTPSPTESVLVPSIMESFEGTFPPAGWALYSPDGGTGWEQQTVGTTPVPGWTGGTIVSVPNGTGGTKVAFCTWSTGGATANDQWIVTPQITVGANYSLFFYLRKYFTYVDQLDVKISTTNNQMTSFTTTLGSLTFSTADSGWVSHVYSLANYAGQNIYIAFQEHVADNFNDGAALFLDLVQVDLNASVQNTSDHLSLKLFPNPSSNVLFIESQDVISSYRILDLLGQVISEGNPSSKNVTINTSDCPTGLYVVVVNTLNGTSTRKIKIR